MNLWDFRCGGYPSLLIYFPGCHNQPLISATRFWCLLPTGQKLDATGASTLGESQGLEGKINRFHPRKLIRFSFLSRRKDHCGFRQVWRVVNSHLSHAKHRSLFLNVQRGKLTNRNWCPLPQMTAEGSRDGSGLGCRGRSSCLRPMPCHIIYREICAGNAKWCQPPFFCVTAVKN